MGLHPVFQSLLERSFFDSEYHPNCIVKLFHDGLRVAERLEVHISNDCWFASFRYNGRLYVSIGASEHRQSIEGVDPEMIDHPCDELERWLHGAVVFESMATEEMLRSLVSGVLLGMIPRALEYIGVPPSAVS